MKNEIEVTCIKLLMVIFIALVASGCGAMGVKEVDMWGLKWKNFAGQKVSAGYNNIDYVDDYEGVGARSSESVGKAVSEESKRY